MHEGVHAQASLQEILEGDFRNTTRAPGNQALTRKIRVAQFTYWCRTKNAWTVSGMMLDTLFHTRVSPPTADPQGICMLGHRVLECVGSTGARKDMHATWTLLESGNVHVQ